MPHDGERKPISRGRTESELLATANQSSVDMDDAPYRARLYQLFGLIEKEFDSLYSENCALRARIAQLTQSSETDATVNTTPYGSVPAESFIGGAHENVKVPGSGGRKAMQMGQKLRTALRGPPVFRDGTKFRFARHFEGHRDGVWHVTADASRNVAASSSADQSAKIWSLDTGSCIATYTGHSGSVNCVSMSQLNQMDGVENPTSLLVATASGDEETHIWKIQIPHNGQIEGSSEEDDEKAGESTIPNNLLGIENAGCSDQTTQGKRVRTPIIRLAGHHAPVSCCEWLAGSQNIVTASWDRTARVFDVEKGEVLSILSGHESELNHCSTHQSQKLVLTSSKDSTFRLWDFRETIQSVAVFQGHQESVTSVGFTSDYRIVSSSDDSTVKIWDLRNMRTSLATIRLTSAANRVAVSKNHGVLAIPMDNRHVRIYDLNGNRLPRMPNRRCHNRMVTCCAWIDDHSTHNLLTSGFDRLIAGWKVNVSTKDS